MFSFETFEEVLQSVLLQNQVRVQSNRRAHQSHEDSLQTQPAQYFGAIPWFEIMTNVRLARLISLDYYKDFYIIFLRFPSYDGRDTIVLRLKSFIRKTSIPRFIDK